LPKNNFFRRLVGNQKWNLIYGQLINAMVMVPLTWTLLFFRAGAVNFRSKVNTIVHLLFFFVALLLPIYYFFYLLKKKKRQLLDK
jgi:hypothetical protein